MLKLVWYFFCLLFVHFSVHATYNQVYSTVTNGGISYTGNTLGLNKATNQNQPGTSGSNGAFISTDTSLKVGNFPAGTTLNYTQNSSAAVLDLPPGSTVLHAELIWSGNFGFNSSITQSQCTTSSINFITPDSVSHTISPTSATTQAVTYTDGGGLSGGFYVCSSDVTSFVIANGAGTYAVGGVPAGISASSNNSNCAGWTLAVAYQNGSMKTSNLNLFVSCELTQANTVGPIVSVSGFKTPLSGAFTSRLFISALEGDTQLTGDQLKVGPISPPANAVSGSNNPANNFFGCQINTLLPLTTEVSTGKLIATGSSLLDTRGTFGNLNGNASTGQSLSGQRQGYDITSIDIGGILPNGATQFFAQGTTNGDTYLINSMGVQIQVDSPIITGIKSADITSNLVIGQIVTYTITITNTGLNTASNLTFSDLLPTGLTYVPNSFILNGNPVPGADITTGVSIGNLVQGATDTITFKAQVTQINPPESYTNQGTINYEFDPFGTGTPIQLQSQTNQLTITASPPPPVANPDAYTASTGITFNSPTTVLTNDTGTNITVSAFDSISTKNGSIVMQPSGTFTYLAASNFSGTGANADTFQYTIKDSLNRTSTTTVTMTVLPLAQNDTATVSSNTTLNQPVSVLANDNGTSLTVTPVSGGSTTNGGTYSINSSGFYTYKSSLNFTGVDTFTYTATDSSGQPTSATVSITVQPPTTNDIGTTPANVPLNATTSFTTNITSYDMTSSQGGTISMNTATGEYTYTPPFLVSPNPSFSGIDTFFYITNSTQSHKVTITVTPVAINDTNTTPANTPVNENVLTNDIGASLTTNFPTTTIQGGILVTNPNGDYTYTPPNNFSGQDSFIYTATDSNNVISNMATVTITVTPVALPDTGITPANQSLINQNAISNDIGTSLSIFSYVTPTTQGGVVSMNTNGTYTYLPPYLVNGTKFSGTGANADTFTYTDIDSSGQKTTTTVKITVTPLAFDQTVSTNFDTPLNGPSVLDSAIGTGVTVTSNTPPAHGSVAINSDGTYIYTPNSGYSGPDQFTYTITDSSGQTATANVLITVGSLGPTSFTGKIKKGHLVNGTCYSLQAQWTSSASSNIAFYSIYDQNGKLVAKVNAGKPLALTTCLSSKKDAFGYTITATDTKGNTSTPMSITIVQ